MARCFLRIALAAALLFPAAAPAQIATVGTLENFRAEPNGTILAEIEPGTVLAVVRTDGAWVEASVEGWIWRPSVSETDRAGFDLRVSADGGENLRVEPQGTILARLSEGTLLEELERTGNWVRVRRTAWIWSASVELDAEGSPEGRGDGDDPPPPALTDGVGGWTSLGGGRTPLLAAPDGSDTLAWTPAGADVQVLGRRGGWARVRVEGWVWMPSDPDSAVDGGAILEDVTPEDLADDPERFRGRIVSWELQFVSLEEAESIRTEFYEGEPYLLTRFAGQSSSFVYVAVPPDRLASIGNLIPLERIRVVGRVRAPDAALTGGPILDLLEIARIR